MSELIKENTTGFLIAMSRLRLVSPLGIAIMLVLLLSAAQPTEAASPNIWAWGLEGKPELGQGFGVWANVSDEDSDLKNVTVEVIGPNMSINNPLTFNGTYYTGAVPAFPNSGEFSVRIWAHDNASNTRNSALIYVQYDENPEPPIDPFVTMPIVVVSSVSLMAIVIVIAFIYDRRNVLD